MKTAKFVFALVAALCGPVIAQDKPPVDIPLYPGGETILEINLTNEELLPTIKASLPFLAGRSPMIDKIDPEAVAEVLKDIKRAQLVQLEVSKKTALQSLTNYYARNVPKGKWSRVFWQSLPDGGAMAIYTREDAEGIYGFRTRSAVSAGKAVTRVEVAKIDGKIDFAKLLEIGLKLSGSQ
jgi:hypothetical protein